MKKRLARSRRVAVGGARPASPRLPALPRRADEPTVDDARGVGRSTRAAGADVGGVYAVPAVDQAAEFGPTAVRAGDDGDGVRGATP